LGVPLVRWGPEDANRLILLNLGNEVFFNAGGQIVYIVFDQNRFIISPTVKINQVSYSLTWSNQFAGTAAPGAYVHTQVLWIQVKQQF
jgi:hypothetical protein